MHKAKPHKGTLKRLTISARRKVRRKSSYAGHLMSGKPGTRRQRLRKIKNVDGGMRKRILKKLNLPTAWPYPPQAGRTAATQQKGD